jgi:hypothetical protein
VFVQAGIASGALASAAVGATNVAGTLIATGLIEGAGRKQLLTASYLGMAATMALMAAGFGLPALAPYRCGGGLPFSSLTSVLLQLLLLLLLLWFADVQWSAGCVVVVCFRSRAVTAAAPWH